MGRQLDLIAPIHKSTARDYVGRMTNNKAANMRIARRFDVDFWDGDRSTGYGGYRRDPNSSHSYFDNLFFYYWFTGDRHALECLGHQQLDDLGPLRGSVRPHPGDLLALADRAVVDPAQGQPAEVRRGVQVGDVGLQGGALLVGGAGDPLDDGAEERLEVLVGRQLAVAIGLAESEIQPLHDPLYSFAPCKPACAIASR